ncbi:14529_t:CDS:2, partial [Gigaspora rosea]
MYEHLIRNPTVWKPKVGGINKKFIERSYHSRIGCLVHNGVNDYDTAVKITCESVEYDTSLDRQKQEKLKNLKEIPIDTVKATILAISSLHENNKLAISSTSCKNNNNQNDICIHISNLKSILEKFSDEAHNAYDDIYNALETLNKTDLTKFDDSDTLTIDVIDISSEWTCSYLKSDTIDFLKGDLSNRLILDKSITEECNEIIQKHHMNTDLKWVISENSVTSLSKWVESVESQKHCAQKILECLTGIWNLSTTWSKNQSERIYIAQIVEPLISVALENLPERNRDANVMRNQ